MKTMKSLKGKIVRVSDERASELYHEGFKYLPKSEWKEATRTVDKEVHESPVGVGFAHTDTKANKMSKAQKRQIRKTL
tara:strand:+ start:388 stop:621 length:234 start_codon:yes stop_codon:yes gene_type:complete